ncbi:MAG: AlpA family transcriptional regulator [Massilia sp.]|uniref:helix-turn-helix transcriptional regulator n=1 Tax=Massilia sp. TaxID=1882437 RepID=UPI002FC8C3FA
MKTILRINAVKELTGLGRSSIYDKIKRNEFPPPILLGPRAVGWLFSDLDTWLNAQAASSPRHNAWRAAHASGEGLPVKKVVKGKA